MKRIVYLVLIVGIVCAGLLSRRVGWLPAGCGDGLWAMMMFCLWRVVFIRRRLWWVAFSSLVTCYCVEASQLIGWQWLVDLRHTLIGHLLLGQGFLLSDLVAYTIGIAIIFFITHSVGELLWLRRSTH